MQFSEKLESIDCRKDTKARRRLNDEPNTVCNITAEQLEAGISLEALDNCNTNVHCYGGQLTIHGLMPDFNPAARPNGYKSLFRNGNGSIGVRYNAIDGEKKAIIQLASQLKKDNGWHVHFNCTSFEISKSFYVKDETQRQAQKEATIACLKTIPAHRFFGSVFAYTMMYGMGYGAACEIGAIPQSELWPFINELFGITNEEEFNQLKNAKEQKELEERKAREIEQEKNYVIAMEKKTARLARFAEFKKTLESLPKVTEVKPKVAITFYRYKDDLELPDNPCQFGYTTITIAKRGFRYCYNMKKSVTIGYDYSGSEDKWKMIEDRHITQMNELAKAGLLYSSHL